MKRFTDKTFRNENKWVKITRDNKEKTFTFALGDKGEFQAYNINSLKFKWCANWTEAQTRANYLMTNF